VPDEWLQGGTTEFCEIRRESNLPGKIRRSLARLAATARDRAEERLEPPGARAVQAALEGAELLMYSEIVTGRGQTLARYLPSFAFMAVLPSLGRRRALQVAERAAELLESRPPQ